MCGIIAVHSGSGGLVADQLDGALAALAHRGPDGRGSFVSADGRCALGHTRLAIIDIAGGAQPLSSEDNSITAIVNGELYGFETQRQTLAGQGHSFRSGSDSELVVHLYEQYGLDFVHHLRGEFAAVIWDARHRRLIACRDRFGVKPLLMARHRDRTYFASSAKALFAAGIPAAWDVESLFDAAGMHYVLPTRTLFDTISTVEPGHLVVVDHSGHLRQHRYWDLDYPADHAISDADAIDEVKRVFTDAVRVRLRADVAVATQLSGGMDSTAVSALASEEPVHCFSLAFDDARYDESAIAAASARELGAELHLVRASRDSLVDALSDAVWFGEGIGINGHLPAKLLLSRAVRDAGFKVVLTGEGADEVFAGYAHLRADLGADVGATNTLSSGIMLASGDGLSTRAVADALGFVPSYLAAKASFGARVRSLLDPSLLARFAERDSYALLMEQVDQTQLAGRHRVEQSMYLWTKTALPTYLLRTLGDGMEMASSIEGRLPFLDNQLFDLVRRLPMHVKIRHGVEKWVLRQALHAYLPSPVRSREKHPLLAPPLADSPRFTTLLRGLELPFFDKPRVAAMMDTYATLPAEARGVWDPVFVFIATVGLMHERFRL